MELLWEAGLDALLDSLKMLPFLYLAYWLIEAVERSHGARIERILAQGGKWGFLAGGVLGCLPQCGFSAMAANLYASRVISLGTLMAVFVATSDEAVPMLLSMPQYWPQLLALLGLKLVFALAAGFLLDVVLRRVLPASLRGGYKGRAEEVDCFGEHGEEKNIWLAALQHTLQIFFFILLFSFGIGLVVALVGEDAIGGFLLGIGVFRPLAAALIGLVPNCAASVLLTQLYLTGALPFSSAVAGLCSGAGVGLAVLFRTNRNLRQNLFIAAQLWGLGALIGLVLQGIGL